MKVLTVSELTDKIKSCLESSINEVWVSGEVSNCRLPSSGHMYFSLKDQAAQIRCVLFNSTRQLLKLQIKDGQEIVVFGRVTVYKKSGDYQIIVDRAEPKGLGALQMALEQLKQKLAKEGLFEPARKKPLPYLPHCIAIVTSPTGAAIQDMLNIINRRFPVMHIIIYPVKVQGEGAKEEIASAIDDLNRRYADTVDVMIVGRGGGSLEDLWAFNEELVARAIGRSQIPIISAVGHEIDYTIADMVADKRALTPSEAAELVVPVKSELTAQLAKYQQKLDTILSHPVKLARTKLDTLAKSYAWQLPFDTFRQHQQRLDELATGITGVMKKLAQASGQRLASLASQLDALSPTQVIKRGYSITKYQNQIIKSIKQVAVGQDITTQLADGNFNATVKEIYKQGF